jgi:hypothetical protein
MVTRSKRNKSGSKWTQVVLIVLLVVSWCGGVVGGRTDKCVLYPRAFARSAAPTVVSDVFAAAGYTPCSDPERASVIWSKNVLDVLVRRDQLANHVPGEHVWTQKEKFLAALRRYHTYHPTERVFDFFPQSFLLHDEEECRAFAEFINETRGEVERGGGGGRSGGT